MHTANVHATGGKFDEFWVLADWVKWSCICCGSISEESETNIEWHVEGRRLIAPLHRHISHAGSHSSAARDSKLSRTERPTNLRSAAATAAAAPTVTKQGRWPA